MTDATLFDLEVIIIEEGDQRKCAHYLAEHFATVSRGDLLDVITKCERELPQMDFHEKLDVLRRELERVHPAFKNA